MTYEEFKEHMLQQLNTALTDGQSLQVQQILKNNNLQLDGLTIQSEHFNISPTLYLNYYYDQYLYGNDFDKIKLQILEDFQKNQPDHNIDISFFTDYAQVQSHIAYKLINYKQNKALLDLIPHYQYLDLAIVFYCLVNTTETGHASILIYNKHLSYWQIDRSELFRQAQKNTPLLLGYDLKNMNELLSDLFAADADTPEFDDIDFSSPYPMYILSNRSRINGASCILYHNLLSDFATKLQTDLYILPSSIHEVIIIPAYASDSYQDLTEMVREVNTSQVSPEEILSDHAYFYSLKNHQLLLNTALS